MAGPANAARPTARISSWSHDRSIRSIRTLRTVFLASPAMIRSIPPWIATVAGLVLAGLVALAVFSTVSGLWRGLPWSAQQRLERAEARLDQVQAELTSRQGEVEALERQAVSVADAHRILNQVRTVTVRAQTRAEEAPDAHDPIDPDRADRLRDADRRLCRLSPDLCPSSDLPAAPGS